MPAVAEKLSHSVGVKRLGQEGLDGVDLKATRRSDADADTFAS